MNDAVKPFAQFPTLSALHDAPLATWQALGCADTLREILQQPTTWRSGGGQAVDSAIHGLLDEILIEPPQHIVATGSGSSLYVGECLAPVLQAQLHVPCRAVAAGTIMTAPQEVLASGSGLLVSIARSGDSPESVGAVDAVLAEAPQWTHLVVTCNAHGQLAMRYRDEPRVRVLLLDPVTNDRSLVMTSSFTNLLLAGGNVLPEGRDADKAAALADTLFERYGDALADCGGHRIDAAVYLGSGANQGAAREAGLKMLEMSAGAVRVMTETSLGLRHGPMAWFNRDSLLVSFLSGRADIRAYEADLLLELTRKQLGAKRVVVGANIDPAWVGSNGLAIDLPGLYELPPVHQAMVHVVVGQLLAFFQCLAVGQHPDAPSEGVLTRVVADFPVHDRTQQ